MPLSRWSFPCKGNKSLIRNWRRVKTSINVQSWSWHRLKRSLPFCSSDKTKAPKLRNEVNSQGDFLSIHYFSWNNVEWLGDENLIKPSPWLTRVSCMWPRKGLIKETIKIAFRKIKSERPNDQFGQKESMGGIFSRAMLMEQWVSPRKTIVILSSHQM